MTPLLRRGQRPRINLGAIAIWLGFGFCAPAFLIGQPAVLINAIPSGAMFLGSSPIGLPFKDAGSQDRHQMEEGLNAALSGVLAGAAQKGMSFVCLMSQPGEHPVHLFIASALADLELSQTNSAVTVLFYRGGRPLLRPIRYTLAAPPAKGVVSVNAKKIAVPAGVTTAGWIYFNLTRVQAQAEKAGSKVIFLKCGGTGKSTPVVIPGLPEPLMAFDDEATFTATWYMDPADDAAHRLPAVP